MKKIKKILLIIIITFISVILLEYLYSQRWRLIRSVSVEEYPEYIVGEWEEVDRSRALSSYDYGIFSVLSGYIRRFPHGNGAGSDFFDPQILEFYEDSSFLGLHQVPLVGEWSMEGDVVVIRVQFPENMTPFLSDWANNRKKIIGLTATRMVTFESGDYVHYKSKNKQ